MLFGKHINKYYLKYGIFFLIGLAALIVVDYVQLEIPNIIGSVIDGLEQKTLIEEEVLQYVKDIAIFGLIMVVGRFLWRIFIFGTSWRIDYDLRNKMFRHAEKLSQTYYSEKKSGGLMALFINDLNAIRMSFGPGLLMLFDILILGVLAFYKMYELDPTITYFAAIPLVLIAVMATYISKITGKKFKARHQAFEDLSDFTQENFYGISVI
jgi:ATP-binding cassette subfamily B protein